MAKICLIVDEEGVRAYLKAILPAENFQPLEAANAPQAFRLVQLLKGNLDLIMTDLTMPGDINGLNFAHAVRNAFPAIPIILISGYGCLDAP